MKKERQILRWMQVLFLLMATCSVQAFGQLWKKHIFSFQNSPDSVTCVYKAESNELIISGFDADGKGTFYFLGGDPLSLTCYQQDKLVYRRPLGIRFSGMVSFRLINDSLYLIHREDHALYRMHRDNKGAIDRIPLKAAPFERCFIGPKQSFTLSYLKNSTTSVDQVYDFHQNLLREYSYPTGKSTQYDPDYQNIPESCLNFYGRYKGNRLFLTDYATVALIDDSGKTVRKTGLTYEDFGWYVLDRRSDTIENWGPTAEVQVLRNGHFYMPAFNAKKELVVWDLDVEQLYRSPDVADEFKVSKPDSIVYYHYAYEEPVRQPDEDEFIALRYYPKSVDLVFWGTTDEFDEAREGYLPGFFVLNHKNLTQKEDTLSCTLSIKNELIFEKPVPVSYASSNIVVGIPLSVNANSFATFFEDKEFQLLKEDSALYLVDPAKDSRKRFVRTPFSEINKLKRNR